MKILFCDLEFDYGIRRNGINFIGRALQRAFIANGHVVETFYYDDFIASKQPAEELQKKVLEKAEAVKPDLIFFPLFTFQFAFATLDRLKEKYLTVAWFGDDTWRFDNYTRLYAPHFSWCVTTDKFSVEKYRVLGQANVILSQWAAIDDDKPEVEFAGNYLYDVTFIGQYNNYRKWFIGKLEDSGVRVECFGKGWKNGIISSEKMAEVFLRSKINLNIGNSLSHDVRFLLSNPVNLARYFFLHKTMGQIKARNFEIPYYGGFQLTDYFPGIEDYFDLSSEIACYKDVDEAIFLVRYYLQNEELRNQIVRRSRQTARASHGYINRIKGIMETIRA